MAEEIRKDGRGVVESHLLEAQSRHEEDTAPEKSPCKHAGHAREDKAKHDGVVLEVGVVNQDRCWLHQDRDERYRSFPGVDASESGKPPVEDDRCGNVN